MTEKTMLTSDYLAQKNNLFSSVEIKLNTKPSVDTYVEALKETPSFGFDERDLTAEHLNNLTAAYADLDRFKAFYDDALATPVESGKWRVTNDIDEERLPELHHAFKKELSRDLMAKLEIDANRTMQADDLTEMIDQPELLYSNLGIQDVELNDKQQFNTIFHAAVNNELYQFLDGDAQRLKKSLARVNNQDLVSDYDEGLDDELDNEPEVGRSKKGLSI